MRRAPVLRVVCALACAALLAGGARADAPAVRPVTPDEFAGEMASLRGQVVMLNVWATWCAPCLKEIPDLVAIAGEMRSRGLVLLGLSVDEPGDVARVESFRQKYFAGFRSLARDSTDADALIGTLDPAWNDVVPTTYFVRRDGRTISRIQGKKTIGEFRAAALAALEPARP